MGESATKEQLQARALPGKNSPKRCIPMEVDTPIKKFCHRTGAQAITCSPLLRPKVEPRKKLNPSLPVSPDTGRPSYNLDEGKIEPRNVIDDGVYARTKRLVKQPLISSMFIKENKGGDN